MNTSNKSLLQILVEELPKHGGWPSDHRLLGAVQDFDREVKFNIAGSVLEFARNNEGIWGSNTHNAWLVDYKFTASNLASDYATAIITRNQYEEALAFVRTYEGLKIENLRFEGGELRGEFTPVPPVERIQVNCTLAGGDGWIDWPGGECPVDSDAIVEVKYRKTNPYQFNNDRAGDFTWSHHGIDGDIIAYRLQQPHEVKTAGIDVQRDAVKSNDAQLEADLNDCIGQPQEDIKTIRAEMLEILNDSGMVMKLRTAMKLVDAFIDAGYRKQ